MKEVFVSFDKEVFVSFDVETDGPCPGINSILSLGAVLLDPNGEELGIYYNNFLPLPGAAQDPDTMEFWKEHPEAWEQTQHNQVAPGVGVDSFMDMLQTANTIYGVRSNLVADPAGFDFSFLHYYLRRFGHDMDTVGFSCIDVRSYIMGATGRPYCRTRKKYWPKRWKSALPHTHNALDDAREQGDSFIKILKESRDG